ncbi:MAG: SAM-dependent methyltransferase [Planctomycetia bacterium]|nr:SAM-dependent methyltransferase [Planctomycetia bacterium]
MEPVRISPFIFITCQVGAEPNVKSEISREFPESRLAFSRPGLLTFKLTESEARKAEEEGIRSVFARSWGFSLGTVRGENRREMVENVWKLAEGRAIQRVHVFPRDTFKIGDFKFEPRRTVEAEEICGQLCEFCTAGTPQGQSLPASCGEMVLDCILINPQPPQETADFLRKRQKLPENGAYQEWLVGFHRVCSFSDGFPGGMLELEKEMPKNVASRAWLKMEEALRWSEFPLKENETVCEIGSAPGGATQVLLSRGCRVIGVDPAEMHPDVMKEKRFTHVRSKIAFVSRAVFKKVRWLTCDINVPPNYTLDVIESIVSHRLVNVRGMLLTLKFPDWRMGLQVEEYLERIRCWGYEVRARQLHYSHQEICVAAVKNG